LRDPDVLAPRAGTGIYRLYELMIGANPATDSHETIKIDAAEIRPLLDGRAPQPSPATQANPRP
jgi:hypothetical protein